MKRNVFRDKNIFLTLFLAGFVTGVCYITVFGKSAVYETSLMSNYFFSKYSYMEFVSDELFLYTLKSRLSTFFLLWMMGLTAFGALIVKGYLFWIGAALGITVTTAAMKMGLRGILFCVGSSLPHFVLYVPFVYWYAKKICEMSGGNELRMRQWNAGKRKLYAYLLVGLIGVLVLLAGAFLESYVNPFFLKTFLKNL